MDIKSIIFAVIPIVLLSSMVYYLSTDGSIERGVSLPRITLERVEFSRDGLIGIIKVYVRNTGQDTITIAQVDVNDEPTHAIAKPTNTLNRLDAIEIIIHYPWIENIPYEIGLTTSDGTRFAFDVEQAVYTPALDTQGLTYFALIGSYVGIMPVVLGFLWLPFMRSIKDKWYEFFLSLTIGLLAFLAIDTILEALDLVNRFEIPNGDILIPVITISTFLALMLIRVDGKAEKGALYIAYMIAIGIGLHNLGEGLAIGASTTIGALALTRFLIIGFTIHNTTEGLAIVSPLSRARVRLVHLAFLGLIAGIPVIFGAWLGVSLNMPIASLIFLSIGAGAIFQIVYMIFAWFRIKHSIVSIHNSTGLIIGMLIMYITSLLVA